MAAFKTFAIRPLLALALVALVLVSYRPLVLSFGAQPAQTVAPVAVASIPVAATPEAVAPTPAVASVATVALADLALEPCRVASNRVACDGAAAELAAYGIDTEDVSRWTRFGLQRVVEGVERLADAFGGGGRREQRIARLALALGTDADGGRVRVVWQATPQQRDGNPVRGGYAANTLFFNPNTLFLDVDTSEEALARPAVLVWWNVVHELAHLWDERSAPTAPARRSAALRRWVDTQASAGATDEYPSSYAVIGGPLEAFADSVAATVTGDAPVREYYGSPRDNFVRTALCEAVGCQR